MPAPGDDHDLLDAMSGLQGLHHEDDRGGLSPVALESTRFSRERTMTVNQQAHDDLGSNPPLLASNPTTAARPPSRPRSRAWSRLQAQCQAPGGSDVIEKDPRGSPAPGPGPGRLGGCCVGLFPASRSRTTGLREYRPWMSARSGGRRPSAQKARSPPAAMPRQVQAVLTTSITSPGSNRNSRSIEI